MMIFHAVLREIIALRDVKHAGGGAEATLIAPCFKRPSAAMGGRFTVFSAVNRPRTGFADDEKETCVNYKPIQNWGIFNA